MDHEKIVKYYRLCTISIGERRLPISDYKSLFTPEEKALYFVSKDDSLAPRDIIGGNAKKYKIMII